MACSSLTVSGGSAVSRCVNRAQQEKRGGSDALPRFRLTTSFLGTNLKSLSGGLRRTDGKGVGVSSRRRVVVVAPKATALQASSPAVQKTSDSLVQKSVNTIRFLAIDAVEKANSGHPGLPMGCAPMGHILYDEVMRYNPKNPYWFNRDRFVLSAGHGCMLQYALLHMAGYDSVKVPFRLAFLFVI